MNSPINKRSASPVILRLDRKQLTEGMRAFLWTTILLILGGTSMFVWLLTRALAMHDIRAITMASSFIIGSAGILYYHLSGIVFPHRAKVFLRISMPIAIGLFTASLYLN